MTRALLCASLIGLSGFAVAADEKADAAKAPDAAYAPADAAKPASEAAPANTEERVLQLEKSNVPPKCVIKPVMSDDDLRACGARVGEGDVPGGAK